MVIRTGRCRKVSGRHHEQVTRDEGTMMMRHAGPILLSIAMAALLPACQTAQSRQEQLATICADPVNREPGSFYWAECQAISPSSDRQLQDNYRMGAPGI